MEQKYTARLENWAFDKKQNVIVGEVYDDINNRFEDGSKIMTSNLMSMSVQVSTPKKGAIMKTLNSEYLLGDKK